MHTDGHLLRKTLITTNQFDRSFSELEKAFDIACSLLFVKIAC